MQVKDSKALNRNGARCSYKNPLCPKRLKIKAECWKSLNQPISYKVFTMHFTSYFGESKTELTPVDSEKITFFLSNNGLEHPVCHSINKS